MTTTNPNLMQYRVLLNEEHSQDFQIAFDCMAEDDDHAQEQAENAEARYGASNAVKMRLILDVTYNLNGENAVEMASNLRKMCNRAIGEGMLTGETDAEVDESDIRVMILPEPLNEDAIAEFMRQRIESGDLALEDIPNRLASYGLMEPQEFVIEVQERMKSAQAD